MIETQRTICEWANATFGYANLRAALRRVSDEVRELESVDVKSVKLDWPNKMIDECADILITLYRVADILGFDLHACVDHKMEINRARKWVSHGDGTGYHVKEEK